MPPRLEIDSRSLRPLIVALVPGQQRSLDQLKAIRVQLSNEVASLINDFGPLLYEDFNEVRILLSLIHKLHSNSYQVAHFSPIC